MRAFRIILALYTVFLTVYPCGEGDSCMDNQQFGSVAFDASSHDEEQGELKLCTPFCNCACCAAQVQFTASVFIEFADQLHNTELKTPYLLTHVTSVGNSIWQPPRA